MISKADEFIAREFPAHQTHTMKILLISLLDATDKCVRLSKEENCIRDYVYVLLYKFKKRTIYHLIKYPEFLVLLDKFLNMEDVVSMIIKETDQEVIDAYRYHVHVLKRLCNKEETNTPKQLISCL